MTHQATSATFLAAFAELERRGPRGPAWLRDLRQTAIAHFAERGLPTGRDEEWKYTSLAPLAGTPFALPGDGIDHQLAMEAIAPFCVGPPSWNRLVFVNGHYAPKLSTLRPLPGGAHATTLAEALITDAAAVRRHLVSASEEPTDAFGLLNDASWQDGAFLHVPAGVTLEEPILLLFVASAPGTAGLVHPRNLVVLERESRATVVESYVALAGDTYLTNATTDLVLGAGAEIDHTRVVQESDQAFHVGRTRVWQERGSRCGSCAVTLGGRLVRNDVHARLGAEGTESTLSGLFVIGGAQHVDTHTVVDHEAPRATSRQLYKGILGGHARGVFNGRIIVRPGANGTDAHQTNKNLLLSDGVEVDSKPQLEIFADDVKCSHGAADGQLALDALFYLRSRGLDEGAARTLLTYGFASEVLRRIRVEPIRAWLDDVLTARLGGLFAEEPS